MISRVRVVAASLYQTKNGIHYEKRWFNSWPKGEVNGADIGLGEVPVRDVVFNVAGVITVRDNGKAYYPSAAELYLSANVH